MTKTFKLEKLFFISGGKWFDHHAIEISKSVLKTDVDNIVTDGKLMLHGGEYNKSISYGVPFKAYSPREDKTYTLRFDQGLRKCVEVAI